MEVWEAIHSRRAVRDYRAQAVDEATLRKLVTAASWAPSGMNDQSWRFTIVTDAALLNEISERAKGWMLLNVTTMPKSEHFRDALRDPNFHLFYHAPALIVISAPANAIWAKEDCGLAAQNLMLAAADGKLGSCWIGFAQGWLNTLEGKELLGLPADIQVVAPLIVGHPTTSTPAMPRKSPKINWVGTRRPDRVKAAIGS
jgi:nitroreductase